MKKQFERELNVALERLHKAITPSDVTLKEAKKCVKKIVDWLQSKSRFTIGRSCMIGSASKKTAIFGFGIDYMLFINAKRITLDRVIVDFKNILMDLEHIDDIRIEEHSIQFKATNMDIRLYLAPNQLANENNGEIMEVQSDQKLLPLPKSHPDDSEDLYTNSAPDVPNFFKRQNGFAHKFLRIVMFWFKSIDLEKRIPSERYLIELVAIAAMIEAKNKSKNSHTRCFFQFLKSMKNFGNLNIVFDEDAVAGSADVDRPRVLDPMNPNNNLAKYWDAESIGKIKCFATETHRRLVTMESEGVVRLDRIFEPQPYLSLFDVFPNNSNEEHWFIEMYNKNSPRNLIIRNNFTANDSPLHYRLKSLQNWFDLMAFAIMASPYCREEDVIQRFELKISTHINTGNADNSDNEVPVLINENNNDYDVTFNISLFSGNSICVSYRKIEDGVSEDELPAKRRRLAQ